MNLLAFLFLIGAVWSAVMFVVFSEEGRGRAARRCRAHPQPAPIGARRTTSPLGSARRKAGGLMADEPTYRIERFAAGKFNVYANERFIGMIYQAGMRFDATQVDGVALAKRSSLGAAIDVLIANDRRAAI